MRYWCAALKESSDLEDMQKSGISKEWRCDMLSDISIVIDVLRERAGLKPSPERARVALDAFERILIEYQADSEGLALIAAAKQWVTTRVSS